MIHYSLRDTAQLLGCSSNDELLLSHVAVDSRLVKPGALFFALKGENVDGHNYLEQAAFNGAVAAVVHKSYAKTASCNSFGLRLLYVDDVLQSLQALAKQILARRKSLLVCVTGSVGKTTTKEFISQLLCRKYLVAASPGNSNSQIGLPLSILNHTNGKEDVLVLEMGMTEKGHLKSLIDIAPPHIAVITTTALVHACNFSGVEEIGRTKAEIFSHPQTDVGILDRNLVNFAELNEVGSCRKLSFSTDNQQADFFLQLENNKMVIASPDGGSFLPALPLPGRHNYHNFLAALVVARTHGLDWEEIGQNMAFLQLPERRLELVEKEGILFVNDSYNANELSLKAALNSLPAPKKGGSRFAVIGEMVELGKFSQGCHHAVAEHALKYVDQLFCFGTECKIMEEVWLAAHRPVFWAQERLAIVKKLREVIKPGDVVLLKGSRSKATWKVLEEL